MKVLRTKRKCFFLIKIISLEKTSRDICQVMVRQIVCMGMKEGGMGGGSKNIRMRVTGFLNDPYWLLKNLEELTLNVPRSFGSCFLRSCYKYLQNY